MKQRIRPRDNYARNLLNAFLPDGYADITPQELHAEFMRLWERFGVTIADPKNRFVTMLLHNMSVPSRTGVRAEKRAIADRIVVFSLESAIPRPFK